MHISLGFLVSILGIANEFPFAAASRLGSQREDRIVSKDEILEAKALLVSLGVPEQNLCFSKALLDHGINDAGYDTHGKNPSPLPECDPLLLLDLKIDDDLDAFEERRFLEEEEPVTFAEDPVFFLTMASCTLFCVMLAALAAGLTMGMLSLDPLMLLVKIRASQSEEEKRQAEAVLPIVKQHHLLLVTLLLLNSIANEALPLFLDKLVSPVVAVLLSVSFVLIFGEILPSAIFTGPKKLELASRMVPLVNFVMTILLPITYPIAKFLDQVLHEEGDGDGAFDRGEISALVRIQYEERLANKRQRKKEKMESARTAEFPHPKPRSPDLEAAIKVTKAKSVRLLGEADDSKIGSSTKGVQSIHFDEVQMVEGALQMKTKTALQVYTALHRMFAVPADLILNERNVVDIYSSGYSRIPVYEKNPNKPKCQIAIKGILNTKNLIVVNPNENRPLSTMPLQTPPCVSPTMNLVELVNLFQTGKYGHFALVCARPKIGTEALQQGKPIPDSAAFMGIVTLEDVLEALLQEEIFDENDQNERDAAKRIAIWAARHWKSKTNHRKSMATVVQEAAANAAGESTSLLGTGETSSERKSIFKSMKNIFKTSE